MKRAISILILPLVLAACGGATYGTSGSAAGSTTSPSAGPATVSVASSTIGNILVDGTGKTLYLFEADKTTQSTCSGACARAWPPLTTVGVPKAAAGASQSLLGTTSRSDGTTQVTYAGHPVYFFFSDTKPGDTLGQGSMAFGAAWYVLSPAGVKIDQS